MIRAVGNYTWSLQSQLGRLTITRKNRQQNGAPTESLVPLLNGTRFAFPMWRPITELLLGLELRELRRAPSVVLFGPFRGHRRKSSLLL
jgi:hypothetical protein